MNEPLPPKPTYPTNVDKASAGIIEHYCMHPGCNAWGSFGFDRRYGMEWYCREHKGDGEA